MTPQEAERVAELFDRLRSLENNPRDPEAERLIRDGLRHAPNAVYALVQTVLVQDDALRQADTRIRELESGGDAGRPQETGGSFLDSMRDALFGAPERPRGSVPRVPSQGEPMGVPPGFGERTARPSGPAASPEQTPQRGGSFLGTAAAAAAGVIGGSLLLDGIRSAMGTSAASRQGMADASGASPWGGDAGSGDLGRQAGVNDVGQAGQRDQAAQGQGRQDQDRQDQDRPDEYDTAEHDGDFDDDEDFDADFDLGGDSDFA